MANWSTLSRSRGVINDTDNNTVINASINIDEEEYNVVQVGSLRSTTDQQIDIDGARIFLNAGQNVTADGGGGGLDNGIRLTAAATQRCNITNSEVMVASNDQDYVWGARHGGGTTGNRGHNLEGTTMGVADGITGSTFTINQNGTDPSTWTLPSALQNGNLNLDTRASIPGTDLGSASRATAGSTRPTGQTYVLTWVANTQSDYEWTAVWDADWSAVPTTNVMERRSPGGDIWVVTGEAGRWQPTALRLASNNATACRARALYHFYPDASDENGTWHNDVRMTLNLATGRESYVKPLTFDYTSAPSTIASLSTENSRPAANRSYLIQTGNVTFDNTATAVTTLSEPTPGTDTADFRSLTLIIESGRTIQRTSLMRNADGEIDGSWDLGATIDTVWQATVTNGGYDTSTAASTLDELYCQAKQVLYDANANTDEISFDTTTGEINFGAHDVTLISNLAMAYDETTGFSLATAATLSNGDTISVIEGTGDLHFGDRSPSGLTISMNVEGLPNTITNNFTIGQTGESHSVDLTAQSDIEWDVDFAGTVTLNAGAGRTVNFGRTGGTGTYTSGTGTINNVSTVTFEAPSSGTVNVFSVDGTTFTHRGTMTSTSADLERNVSSGEDSWVVVHGGPGFNTQVYRTGTITATTTVPAPTPSSDALSNAETSGENVYSGGSATIQGTPTAGEGNTTIRIDGTDRGSGSTNPIPNGIQTNNLLGTLLDDQDYQLAIAVNNNTLATGAWRIGSDINNLVTFIASNTSDISDLVELDSDGNTVERLTGVEGDFSISGGTASLNGQDITINLVDIRSNDRPDANVIGNVVADRLTGDIDDAVQAANDARDAAQNTEAEVLLNTF